MDAFRTAVQSGDSEGVAGLLSDDVIFRSPAVYQPYQGREPVRIVLAAVAQVFEDFRYVREIGAADAADHAHVFRARIGDREVEGCDFLHIDDRGQIDEFYVMVRPLSALLALVKAMNRQLGRIASKGAPGGALATAPRR